MVLLPVLSQHPNLLFVVPYCLLVSVILFTWILSLPPYLLMYLFMLFPLCAIGREEVTWYEAPARLFSRSLILR
jgi:type IV secretory pathway VirB3-like protein